MKYISCICMIFLLLSCNLWESKPKNPEHIQAELQEEPQAETQEESQETVTFDDIAGPFDELGFGEKEIFFLYLHEMENRAHEISTELARETIEKTQKEAKEKKESEASTASGDDEKLSHHDNQINQKEENGEKTEKNIDKTVDIEEQSDPTSGEDIQENEEEEDNSWFVFQYAKQLTRENWPTIFAQVKDIFPNVDFTGFDEYLPSDWDAYLQKMNADNPDGINILTPEEKAQYDIRYKMIFGA